MCNGCLTQVGKVIFFKLGNIKMGLTTDGQSVIFFFFFDK